MIQLIPFDQSKGGKIPNLCLDNVVKGYQIQNKYASAWEAWQHTEQHTDPVPSGLDVPLFYAYTTTLDGITKNYGHINVRLANGTVWSDGNIYANIEAYEAHHDPKFVGWGESVNDYKIIGGDMATDSVTYEEAVVMYEGWVPGGDVNSDFCKAQVGKRLDDVLHTLQNEPSINKYRSTLAPSDLTLVTEQLYRKTA